MRADARVMLLDPSRSWVFAQLAMLNRSREVTQEVLPESLYLGSAQDALKLKEEQVNEADYSQLVRTTPKASRTY